MNKEQIGFAIRFNETEETKSHLDILREEGKVLWGAWRKPGSKVNFSERIKNIINSNTSFYYAIGQTTVWKMHVIKALTSNEVIEQKLEYLIPSYYTINKPVYIWYLIDDIKDYENRNCLSVLYSSGGNNLENIHQIPGNAPWGVYSNGNEIEHYVPNIIPRTVNKFATERGKLTSSLRYDILKRDGFRCQICGRKISDDPDLILHVDHIIPISKGGLTIWNNLRTLCQDCNLGKSNKIE
jgi:hypothetical protein